MKIREPLSHWNNFTIAELKSILEHCVALDKLGIAQDEAMMASIERDIALREEKANFRKVFSVSRRVAKKQQSNDNLIEQTA